ncbi:MAG: DUF2075 domain-containing protein [Bacteroidales bacterium]|nr:DUF2075 domain-containing protein [Candidatus Liminaster caballi]
MATCNNTIDTQYNSYTIDEFLSIGKDKFLSDLTNKFFDIDHSELAGTQRNAWSREYDDLIECLQGKKGRIVFEYNIPSLSKTIDVVLLLEGKIFVLEYKTGDSKETKSAIRQVEQYSLLLKYCHSTSNDNWIIPILIATGEEAQENTYTGTEEDMVYNTLVANTSTLPEIINNVCRELPFNGTNEWERTWEHGIYKASPTIIEAAKNVWRENNVEGFKKGESDESTRLSAEDFIKQVIEETKTRPEGHRHSICFVTGVPGAGKTLVGLNLSVALQEHGASMLSGNGPLVAVMSAALSRDYQKYKREKASLKDVVSIDAIIRDAYGYKKEIFEKRLEYIVGEGTVKLKENADKGSQHIIIFDEAQRAWTQRKMIKPGQAGKKYWQEELFPFSEPGILLWDMNLRDWGVFVCLVGGGQEIHDGEAGINEWLRALKNNDELKGWHIYLADELKGTEYNREDEDNFTIEDYRKVFIESKRLTIDKSLHLTACQRTPRSEKVSEFIQELLECKKEHATELYSELKSRYMIYLTRDIETAKTKLRERHEQLTPMNGDKNETRMGMLMSSNAERLRPYGYASSGASKSNSKVASWFLDTDEYVSSSNFLEIALDEFCVQGLELDLDVVMWDGDFRYNPETNNWDYYKFNGKVWSPVDKTKSNYELQQFYMKNAYRVLLTRARKGMIIFVPDGDSKDKSRAKDVYDSTFNYLLSLGLQEL